MHSHKAGPLHPQRRTPSRIPLCEIRASDEGGAHVIRVRGELDLSDCPRLEGALANAESSQAAHVLVDCNELELIDAAGLHSLLAASRRAANDGDRLRITRGEGTVAKTFKISGLDTVLPLIGEQDGV